MAPFMHVPVLAVTSASRGVPFKQLKQSGTPLVEEAVSSEQ